MSKSNNKWKAHEKIKELEAQGYRVEVEHERWTNAFAEDVRAVREERDSLSFKFGDDKSISPTGGATYVEIHLDQDGEYPARCVAVGQSECSVYDNFNKKLGIQIALGRAIAGSHEL